MGRWAAAAITPRFASLALALCIAKPPFEIYLSDLYFSTPVSRVDRMSALALPIAPANILEQPRHPPYTHFTSHLFCLSLLILSPNSPQHNFALQYCITSARFCTTQFVLREWGTVVELRTVLYIEDLYPG